MLCFPLSQKEDIEGRRLPQPPKQIEKKSSFFLGSLEKSKVVVFPGQPKHTGLSRRFRWLPEKYRVKVVVFLCGTKKNWIKSSFSTGQTKHTGLGRRFRCRPEKYRIKTFYCLQIVLKGDSLGSILENCFICRPSDSTVSEDHARIEPRTFPTLALAVTMSDGL